ncbi:hypothetical protein BJ912DRAFT_1142521 [Pholiota molesta]|nr:hypothetical protein BJ912DRAFT_1142521 [Pholiota molesta]
MISKLRSLCRSLSSYPCMILGNQWATTFKSLIPSSDNSPPHLLCSLAPTRPQQPRRLKRSPATGASARAGRMRVIVVSVSGGFSSIEEGTNPLHARASCPRRRLQVPQQPRRPSSVPGRPPKNLVDFLDLPTTASMNRD